MPNACTTHHYVDTMPCSSWRARLYSISHGSDLSFIHALPIIDPSKKRGLTLLQRASYPINTVQVCSKTTVHQMHTETDCPVTPHFSNVQHARRYCVVHTWLSSTRRSFLIMYITQTALYLFSKISRKFYLRQVVHRSWLPL